MNSFFNVIDELTHQQNIEENTSWLSDFSHSIENLQLCFSILISNDQKSSFRGYAALYMSKIIDNCVVTNVDLANYASQLFTFLKELKNTDNFFFSNSFSLFGTIITKGFIEDKDFNEELSDFLDFEAYNPYFLSQILIAIEEKVCEIVDFQNHERISSKIIEYVPFQFIASSLKEMSDESGISSNSITILNLFQSTLKMMSIPKLEHSIEDCISSLHLFYCQGDSFKIEEIPQWLELLGKILRTCEDEDLSVQILDCILMLISFNDEGQYYPSITTTIINIIETKGSKCENINFLLKMVQILYKYIIVADKLNILSESIFLQIFEILTTYVLNESVFLEEPEILEYTSLTWSALSKSHSFISKDVPIFEELIKVYLSFLDQIATNNPGKTYEVILQDGDIKNAYLELIPKVSINQCTQFAIESVLSFFESSKNSFINSLSTNYSGSKEYDVEFSLFIKILDSLLIISSSFTDQNIEYLAPVFNNIFVFIRQFSQHLERYHAIREGTNFIVESSFLCLIKNHKFWPFQSKESLLQKVLAFINTDALSFTIYSFYEMLFTHVIPCITIFQNDIDIFQQIISVMSVFAEKKTIFSNETFDSIIYMRTPEELPILANLEIWEISFRFLFSIAKIQEASNNTQLNEVVLNKISELEENAFKNGIDETTVAIFILNISALLNSNFKAFVYPYLEFAISSLPHLIDNIQQLMEKQLLVPILFKYIESLFRWMNEIKDRPNDSSIRVLHFAIISIHAYLNEFKKALDSEIPFNDIEETFETCFHRLHQIIIGSSSVIHYLLYYNQSCSEIGEIYDLMIEISSKVTIPHLTPFVKLINNMTLVLIDFLKPPFNEKIIQTRTSSLSFALDYVFALFTSPQSSHYSGAKELTKIVTSLIINGLENEAEDNQFFSSLVNENMDVIRSITMVLWKDALKMGTVEGESLYNLCKIGPFLQQFIDIINDQVPEKDKEKFSQFLERLKDPNESSPLEWSLQVSSLLYFLQNLSMLIHI